MILEQGLPTYVAAHTPNHIILSGCVGRVFITASGGQVEAGFNRYPNGGDLVVNLSTVLRKVYAEFARLEYTDPFEYAQDVLYSTFSDYHFVFLAINITDQQEPISNLVQLAVRVVNAALQIGGEINELTEGMTLSTSKCYQEVPSTLGTISQINRDGDITGVVRHRFDLLTFVGENARIRDVEFTGSVYGAVGNIPVTLNILEGGSTIYTQVQNVAATDDQGGVDILFELDPLPDFESLTTYTVELSVDGSLGHRMTIDTFSTAGVGTFNYLQYDENNVQIGTSPIKFKFTYLEYEIVEPEGVALTWEGYPMSVSVLENNGIRRKLINDGTQITQAEDCTVKVITPECGGVYLKWLNELGGYDYWLFDPFTSPALKTSDVGSIDLNFTDFKTATGREVSRGRRSYPYIEVSSMIKREYWDKMVGLLDSPEVYLYTGEQGSGVIEFIRVQISTGNQKPFKPKANSGVLKFTVELPERYRQVI